MAEESEILERLAVIDERTANMQTEWKEDCGEIKKRLDTLNGTVGRHDREIAENKERSKRNELLTCEFNKTIENVHNSLDHALIGWVTGLITLGVTVITKLSGFW